MLSFKYLKNFKIFYKKIIYNKVSYSVKQSVLNSNHNKTQYDSDYTSSIKI